ncbi:MAG: hypothetical protein ABEJ31_08785 [Haloarculaceae archaeon]
MDDSETVELLTLWFVVLIFVQTTSGGANPVVTAIGMFAIFLVYAIPVAIAASLVSRLLDD